MKKSMSSKQFAYLSRPALGPNPASCVMVWQWCGIDHPHLSRAGVKERVELYLYSPWAFIAYYRVNCTFTFTLVWHIQVYEFYECLEGLCCFCHDAWSWLWRHQLALKCLYISQKMAVFNYILLAVLIILFTLQLQKHSIVGCQSSS